MTACKDSLSGKKALSATLAGVLAVGMVPAAAFAADADQAADTQDEQGIDLLVYGPQEDFAAGTVLAATGAQGVAYDDPANIQITAGQSGATIVPTKVQTKEDKNIVVLPNGTVESAKYVAADKNGNLPKGTTYANAGTTTDASTLAPGTYYAVFQVKSDAFASTDANSKYNKSEIALKFTVVNNALKDAAVYEKQTGDKANDLSDTTFTYNGGAQNIGIKIGDKALKVATTSTPQSGDECVVEFYEKGSATPVTTWNAGDYTAVVKGVGSYAGSKVSIDFTVSPLDLSKATIVLSKQGTDKATNDLTKATIGQINDLKATDSDRTAFDTIVGQLQAKFVSGPDGSAISSAKPNGTYNYTVSAPKQAGVENKNFTGTQTVGFDKVASTSVDWKYGEGSLADYFTDHSLTKATGTHDGHTWNKADFDISKVAVAPQTGATNAAKYDSLDYTYTVKDEEGNVVSADKLATAGTWTVVYKVDASKCDYDFGGTFTQTVTVTEGTVDGDAAVVLKQDGKVVENAEYTYDGTDALKKLDLAVTVNGKPVDYTLEVRKDSASGEKVTEAVNHGTYHATVKVNGYELKNNTFTVTVDQVDMTHVRVAGLSSFSEKDAQGNEKGYGFLPYTGEAITPSFEYQTNYAECQKDSSIEPEYAPIPTELYTDLYTYNKTENDATTAGYSSVAEVKDAGTYLASFTKVSAKDKEGNYNIDTTNDVRFNVSKHKFFYDVQATDWFYTEVNKAVNLSYMNGYADTKFFGPNDNITRGQVAVVLFNMANGNLESGDFEYDNNGGYTSFDDVDGSQYYAKAVAWAKAAGIVNGYGDGTFKPENSITREEFAVMLANYAKKVGNFEAADGSALAALPDASGVSDRAKEAVAWAVENGYMGKGGFVNAQGDIIRAEAAAMAVRYQPEALA